MTGTVRFVHAADLHLGAPFQGVRAEDERVRDALVRATRESLRRVVSLAVDEGVDFVVIAGDVYDAGKDLRAYMDFRSAAETLEEHGVPVFVARGNHDPEDAWSAALPLPDNVRYFPSDRVARFEVEDVDGGVCAVYGRSYRTRVEERALAADFSRDARDDVAVAVLHANVGGQEGYEPYAPSSLDDLRGAGMDYWALGHVHKPGVLSESPYVAYAGSPQGLDANEVGPRGVRLVELAEGGVDDRFVETHAVLWTRAEVDVTGVEDEAAVAARIHGRLDEVRSEAGAAHVIARLSLTGETPVHDALAGDGAAQLLEHVRERYMADDPWLWVDRLTDRTAAPIDLDAIARGAGLDADLVSLAAELLEDEDAAAELVEEASSALSGRLDARTRPELDPAEVVAAARDECLRRLGAGEG